MMGQSSSHLVSLECRALKGHRGTLGRRVLSEVKDHKEMLGRRERLEHKAMLVHRVLLGRRAQLEHKAMLVHRDLKEPKGMWVRKERKAQLALRVLRV